MIGNIEWLSRDPDACIGRLPKGSMTVYGLVPIFRECPGDQFLLWMTSELLRSPGGLWRPVLSNVYTKNPISKLW